MITIALDEQGDFEGLKSEKAPIFIGGVIYDDKGCPGESDRERERIIAYLKAVCTSVGQSFPDTLHINKEGNNGADVARVKDKLNLTLSEFIQRGTYCNKELLNKKRVGEYYLFAHLRGENGKEELLGESVGELISDGNAGNLYVHMSEDVISRILFHNPLLSDISKIYVDLATRCVVYSVKPNKRAGVSVKDAIKKVSQYYSQFEKLGYRKNLRYSNDTKVVIPLTNVDNYRTSIAREMLQADNKNIQIERFCVNSISYNQNSERAEKSMAFLYMSDILCSKLGWKVKGKSEVEWMCELEKRMQEISGKDKNLLFGYDAVDSYYSRAWEQMENGDYYKALSYAYEGMQQKRGFVDYYSRVWFQVLREKIGKSKDYSAYKMALRKMQESFHGNNLHQEKLLFIFNTLLNMTKQQHEVDRDLLYDLYDTGVTAYTHIGDSKKAKEFYKKCVQYVDSVGVETFLATRNKMVVFLSDNFQFREAVTLAKQNIHYQEQLVSLKQELLEEKTEEFIGYAISLSQCGQACSYYRDETAEQYFMKSLEIHKKGTDQYFTTMSYLLHYYINMNEKEKYDILCLEYLGNEKDMMRQFRYIVREGSKKNSKISLKFAFYVFIKGLYTFHRSDLTNEEISELLDVEKTLSGYNDIAAKQLNGHPWEMIYKYMAFFAIDMGEQQLAERIMEKATNIVKESGDTINLIIQYGEAEYANLIGDIPKRDERVISIYKELARLGINDAILGEVNQDNYNKLKEYFTYTYC